MIIFLTKNELCYIDDSLTLLQPRYKDPEEEKQQKIIYRVLSASAETAAPVELLDIIGSALIEAHDLSRSKHSASKAVPLELSEEYLWLLREIANTKIVFGEEAVGYNLKIKIHHALRQIRRDEILGSIDTVLDASYDKDRFDAFKLLEADD